MVPPGISDKEEECSWWGYFGLGGAIVVVGVAESHCVVQASFELCNSSWPQINSDPPVSASWVLEITVWTVTSY